MDKIKAFFILVTGLFKLLTVFTQCYSDQMSRYVSDDNFYYYILDENNVAIGNVKTYPENGAVFFPERFENYTVSQIGYNRGGYLSTSKEGEPTIQRCYFPHTIKDSNYNYMKGWENRKIFYCGEVIDLYRLGCENQGDEVYVPAEKYDLFKNVLWQYFKGSLLKANVSYHLNYDEDNYYYIDYYENGEKILYIPPIPQRDGYTFGGWFKEADCINQWDFDTDTLQLSEEIQEIKLYAKWIAEQ